MSLELKRSSSSRTSGARTAGRQTNASLVPPVARVNLLPKEIADRRGLRSLQRMLAAGVAAVILLGVGLVVVSSMTLSQAQEQLTAEQQRTTTLLAEQRRYAEVTFVTDRLKLTNDALEYVSRSDVDWSLVLGMIASVTPDDVLVESMTADTATPLVGAGDGAEALMPVSIGSFELVGTAIARPDISTWSNDLEALPGIAEARISIVTKEDGEGDELYAVTVTMQLEPTLQRADGRIANLPIDKGTD